MRELIARVALRAKEGREAVGQFQTVNPPHWVELIGLALFGALVGGVLALQVPEPTACERVETVTVQIVECKL
jgi:hypothetical protein